MKKGAYLRLGVLCLGLSWLGGAQAASLGDLLKEALKERLQPAETAQKPNVPSQPVAPVSPVAPSVPSVPNTPASPAAVSAAPREQLLKSLSGGKTSEAEEIRIGQQIAGNLLGVAPLVRDEALQRYVNQVGMWVARQGERARLPWRFGVVESDDINAFAAPGGYIFLTRGLYQRLNNEAELAGVLAHEVGHVQRKHHLKLLQKSQAVAVLGSLLGHKLKDENQLVQNLIGNGAEVVARSLDKDAEYEADRIGLILSARAGYDAYALPAVLADIGHVAQSDKRVSLLFKTHPHPDERLGRLAEASAERLDGLPEGRLLPERFYRLK